ncbi:MAG: hypothetical protein DRG78_01785 [Epsilonproteobacteria bacterium]|nr:MAG: hypothetical protein DRG78_01785 [Campylobacterota bacterium]
MTNTLNKYFEALERLVNGTPRIVKIGAKINPKNVSLEAGRDASAIKSGRDSFLPIIEAINKINDEENKYKLKYLDLKDKYSKKIKEHKDLYHGALNRELMLIERLNTLEKLVNKKELYLPKKD